MSASPPVSPDVREPASPAGGPADRAAVEAELVEAFRAFYRAYARRDEGAVAFMRDRVAPEATGFGTGRDERFAGRDAMLRIFREEVEQQPDPIAIAFPWTEARLLTPSVGLVDSEVVFSVALPDGETVRFDVRLSVVFQHEGGRWRLTHNHGSMPASEQAEGERLPLDALKARNQELERLVAARTADLRAAQAQLVHQEKMASLGALTAGIAHEIKNPLNFVTNFAGLAVELADELAEAEGDDRAEIVADLRDNVSRIAEHGARADAIVTSMMRHAQGGTGHRQPVDLNGLVAEYAGHAHHARLARGAEVALDLRLGDDVGTVEAVPQEIGRVIVALVDNAFDAVLEQSGRDQGEGPPTVTVSTRRAGDRAEVRVSDTGPGIAPDALGRVFEPFYTTKPTGQGHTGLGLSLAHDAAVQGHGGTLTVDSEPGRGATFVLSLPAPEPPARTSTL